MTMRFAACCISGLLVAGSAVADCVPDGLSAETAGLIVHADRFFAEFTLTLANKSTADLGGVIVEYRLTADNRPSSLAEGASQFAHTLDGGLLSGEETSMRDVLSLSEHAAGIIKSQSLHSALSLTATITAAADVEMRPIGNGFDPFQLWLTDVSPIPCE